MTTTIDWSETVALHLAADGGGLLDELKAVRHGTLADLVRYIALLNADERTKYEIERIGDHRMKADEIMELYARDDYPHAA
ncbi:hypothetical protein GTZ99_05150 [Novosphingobium sp. FSY-8]|uniref:Uncharacterized protein n=1 Tax=Novosphingobium ovatum TaxID=1908523 RepID=A0ABW9XBN2_9SPHN|nr:hypothetical protein [Novosphingobium ovatum]NBC35939.1 hypothetical protein [Novosphingobium ovatum]